MTSHAHSVRPTILVLVAALGTMLSIQHFGVRTASAAEVCPPPSTSSNASAAPSAGSSPTGLVSAPPEQNLACVGSMPITGAMFDHWATVASKASTAEPGASISPKPGHAHTKPRTPNAAEVVSEVMGFLVSSDWVIGEAQDLKVHLSERDVRRAFDRISHEQFPRRRELMAFLRSSGETIADLLFRERVDLLSEKIQKRVIAGHHSAAARQQAFTKFIRAFPVKWKAQTYCVQAYAVPDCGHVLATV